MDLKQLNTNLIFACKSNDNSLIQVLLKDTSYHTAFSYDNYHAFLILCEKGNIEVIKYILDFNELSNIPNVVLQKGFVYSCVSNQIELACYLLSNFDVLITKQLKDFLKTRNNYEPLFITEEHKRLSNIIKNNKGNIKIVKV